MSSNQESCPLWYPKYRHLGQEGKLGQLGMRYATYLMLCHYLLGCSSGKCLFSLSMPKRWVWSA